MACSNKSHDEKDNSPEEVKKAVKDMEEAQKNVLSWKLQAEMAKAKAQKDREAAIDQENKLKELKDMKKQTEQDCETLLK